MSLWKACLYFIAEFVALVAVVYSGVRYFTLFEPADGISTIAAIVALCCLAKLETITVEKHQEKIHGK